MATENIYKTVGFRVSADWLSELDTWIQSQPVPPSRSDVIKLAVLQFINRQNAEKAARKKTKIMRHL